MRTGYAAAREVKYELKYIDSARDQRLGQPAHPGRRTCSMSMWSRSTPGRLQGAIAKSELSFARRRKSTLAPEEVGTRSGSVRDRARRRLSHSSTRTASSGTERAALKRRDALIAANPGAARIAAGRADRSR